MLRTAHGPVVLAERVAVRAAGLTLLDPPVDFRVRHTLNVGLLVTDPADRPDRGARLLSGLSLGLQQARDLDTSVTASGATPFGPALVDAATRLLDEGTDALVVTTAGVVGLVGPLCAARGIGLVVADEGALVGHPAQHRSGVLRRSERHWQEAYVLGQWASRHLQGSLFQLVTRDETAGDAVPALRAGFVEDGGSLAGSVEVWPKSATAAAHVAKASGARVIAVHATGNQLREIVGALHRARVPAEIVVVGRGIDPRELVELGRRGPVYAAACTHRSDLPDATSALGHDVADALVEACRAGRLADLPAGAETAVGQESELVVRRSASGRLAVVGRRPAPDCAPDLTGFATGSPIAALPHHG